MVYNSCKPFFVGSLAGCCSATVVAPIDLVKVRIQTTHVPESGTHAPSSASQVSVRRVVRGIWREGGFRSFFPGYSAVLLRQVVYKGAVLGAYDVLLSKTERPVLSSALAATFGASVGNPIDRALVFQQTLLKGGAAVASGSKPGAQVLGGCDVVALRRLNVFQTLRHIARTDGVVHGLFIQGLGANCARAVCLNIGLLASNTTVKAKLRTQGPAWLKGRDHVLSVVSALCAGFLSCVTSQPADLLKVRLMAVRRGPSLASSSSISSVSMALSILREEGPLGFYRGFLVSVVKQAPMATMTLLFQDFWRRTL
mmetsp:Transcript_1962/g.5546  ORF Transcript_1962/g.5546 Transcript_1962/m.5546 type:complete len:312 (-) Transcript_1962:56-991(-)